MNQWEDQNLVAVEATASGKYRIIELPAHATDRIIPKRRFGSEETAKTYARNEYLWSLLVEAADITAEIERRTRQASHPLLPKVLGHLQKCLEELEAMQPLAPAGSKEALENYEAWMAQLQEMRQVRDGARIHALWLVPDEVSDMLHRIDARFGAVRNLRGGNGNDAA